MGRVEEQLRVFLRVCFQMRHHAILVCAFSVLLACESAPQQTQVRDVPDDEAVGDLVPEVDAPPAASLPDCTGPALAALSGDLIAPPGRDSNAYTPPSPEALEALSTSIESALNGPLERALDAASDAGYTLCAEGELVRWTPPAGSGHAWIAVRTSAIARPLIVEVPHAFFETHTLDEGLLIFETVNARALIVTGTHRCASDLASSCSGTTGVCAASGSEAFRRSDMAHTEGAFYHAAHVALATHFASDLVVSLHGFSSDGASLSNGTTQPVAPDAPVARLWTSLTQRLPAELITSCNAFSGAAVDERLCGTTNTQGRHINGSSAPCDIAPGGASERFLHLEQSRNLRDNHQETIAEALKSLFQ